MSKVSLHPCQSCGACCGYFRVSFYWRETQELYPERTAPVPKELTEDSSSFLCTMKGTAEKHRVRCIALDGTIGKEVACSIYSLRPSPCRAFKASFEDGTHQVRCDEARAKYGLRPLKFKDWVSFAGDSPAAKLESHERNSNP